MASSIILGQGKIPPTSFSASARPSEAHRRPLWYSPKPFFHPRREMMPRFIPAVCAVLTLSLLGAPIARAQGEMMKVGVFDPETLWKQTEVGKRFNQDLSAARDRLQAQIDKKQEDLEATKSKLRQQQLSLSDDKVNEMK